MTSWWILPQRNWRRLMEANLGDKDIDAGMLVVPAEFVGAILCSKGLAVVLNVVENGQPPALSSGSSLYAPLCSSANSNPLLAPASSRAAYAGSSSRNTIDAAASSPATSDPGLAALMLYTVLAVSMSSGRSQHPWSFT
uniref:Uncharacterized protein n=1 Tax=Oryza barthii TaxID=65489 RepID=A0A0D3H996_9ORYZ